MQRGREARKVDKTGMWYQGVAMGLVLFFSYGILSIVSYAFQLLHNGVDILDPTSRDLDRIATYVWPFDPDLARFADDAHKLLNAYIAKENVFQTQYDRLDRVWSYIANHHEELGRYGFSRYQDLFATFGSLYQYRDEVYRLMGSEKPATYIIALQNTGEKRPNGGFFGSFVVLTIDKGQIVTFKPVDSYFPKFISNNATILAEPRLTSYMPDMKAIGFPDMVMYGFTDMDGRNIKDLYEKIFSQEYDLSAVQAGPYRDVRDQLHNKIIQGVVFLRTDMFEDLIPGFEKKIWEWQFVNASVDIIRGENRTNKKELYMKEMSAYFDEHRVDMVLRVLGNIAKVKQKNYINVFLSDISKGMNQRLRQNSFTTVYSKDNIYLGDFNYSYNKVDRFVTREMVVRRGEQVVGRYMNQDVVSVRDWESGQYVLDIYYQVNVPQYYRDFILNLAKKYNIKLTKRELGILALNTANRGMLYSYRSVLHMPGKRKVDQITGDGFDIIDDYSDLGHFLSYYIESPFNNSTSHISLTITIP